MTPTSSALGGIEQIFLLIFMLMILVAIAGGNPSMVLKPVFDIVGQLVMALISLLSQLLIALFRVLANHRNLWDKTPGRDAQKRLSNSEQAMKTLSNSAVSNSNKRNLKQHTVTTDGATARRRHRRATNVRAKRAITGRLDRTVMQDREFRHDQ